MEAIIKQIIATKRPCYFISPHLDDAVLSAGDLISQLTGKTPTKVITLFTESSKPPYTFSAKGFLRHARYVDAEKLFADRRREDAEIFTSLGIPYMHLGIQDLSFREKTTPDLLSKLLGKYFGEAKCIYPLGFYNKQISKADYAALRTIDKKLQEIIQDKDAIVFAPLAVGGHVDHQITRNICQKNFPNIIYWTDFPYSVKNAQEDAFIKRYHLKKFTHKIPDHTLKHSLIKIYKTQYLPMFPNGNIPKMNEEYYCAR